MPFEINSEGIGFNSLHYFRRPHFQKDSEKSLSSKLSGYNEHKNKKQKKKKKIKKKSECTE